MLRKSNTKLKYHSSATECSGISLGWGGTRNFIKLKKCVQLRKKIATKSKTTTVLIFFCYTENIADKLPESKTE